MSVSIITSPLRHRRAGIFLDGKVTMCRCDDRRNSRRDSLHSDYAECRGIGAKTTPHVPKHVPKTSSTASFRNLRLSD